MHYIFSHRVKAELDELEIHFQKGLFLWWEDIKRYRYTIDDTTWTYLPAITLCAYKNLEIETDLSIAMTNMLKTFYFANTIHGRVKDDEEGQVHDQDFQFTILIADYIYGRVLKLLLETRTERFLDHYSQMMCEINEGMMLRYKYQDKEIEALEKIKGTLYANAFYTAASLAGLDEDSCLIYRDSGFYLGMSVELHEAGAIQPARVYFHKCEQALHAFSLKQRGAFPLLQQAVDDLKDIFSPAEKAVV